MKRKKLYKLSENELLGLYYRSHNYDALGIALERYTTILLGVAYKYLGDAVVAEDVVQSVFLKAIEKCPENINNLGGWLYRVLRNECVDYLRKHKNLEEITSFQIADIETDQLLYSQIEKNENILRQQIQSLSIEQAKCIELFYLEDKTYAEIATLTGFAVKAIKSYIQNGKRNLKIKLSDNPEFKIN